VRNVSVKRELPTSRFSDSTLRRHVCPVITITIKFSEQFVDRADRLASRYAFRSVRALSLSLSLSLSPSLSLSLSRAFL